MYVFILLKKFLKLIRSFKQWTAKMKLCHLHKNETKFSFAFIYGFLKFHTWSQQDNLAAKCFCFSVNLLSQLNILAIFCIQLKKKKSLVTFFWLSYLFKIFEFDTHILKIKLLFKSWDNWRIFPCIFVWIYLYVSLKYSDWYSVKLF